eukprot:1624273-Prymnesium_polylepis.1
MGLPPPSVGSGSDAPVLTKPSAKEAKRTEAQQQKLNDALAKLAHVKREGGHAMMCQAFAKLNSRTIMTTLLSHYA